MAVVWFVFLWRSIVVVLLYRDGSIAAAAFLRRWSVAAIFLHWAGSVAIVDLLRWWSVATIFLLAPRQPGVPRISPHAVFSRDSLLPRGSNVAIPPHRSVLTQVPRHPRLPNPSQQSCHSLGSGTARGTHWTQVSLLSSFSPLPHLPLSPLLPQFPHLPLFTDSPVYPCRPLFPCPTVLPREAISPGLSLTAGETLEPLLAPRPHPRIRPIASIQPRRALGAFWTCRPHVALDRH